MEIISSWKILVLLCVHSAFSFPASEIQNNSIIWASEICEESLKLPEFIESNHEEDTNFLATYAHNMRNYMNITTDPCEDFYEYACGNWEKYHPIPDGYHKLTVFKIIEMDIAEKVHNLLMENIPSTNTSNTDDETKAKIYYRSCLSRGGVEPLLEFFNDEFGGWPVLTENWNDTSLDWLNATVTVNLFTPTLVRVYVMLDLKNLTQDAIYIDEPFIGLDSPKYYLDKTKSNKVNAYKNLIVDSLKVLGVSSEIASQTADEIIDLEVHLASAMRDPDQRYTDDDEYNVMTIEDLMQNYSQVDWQQLVQLYSDKPIELNQTVIVCKPDFLKPFSEIISKTSKRTMINYFCWRIAFTLLLKLDERFENAFKNFKNQMFGTTSNIPHWYDCVKETMDVTQHAVVTMFVKKYFNETSRNGLFELTNQLKYSFLEIIKDSDWLDDETKKLAIKKLDNTKLEVGYPDWYLDRNQSYEKFRFDFNSYFVNYYQYKLSKKIINMDDSLFTSNIIDAWQLINPINVDAYHIKVTNQIIFPAGILQPPIYHPDFPNAIKFGILGSYIGHEVTHGFDDVGRQYDHIGVMNDWWDENSTENFLKRAQCYVEQYNNYTVQGHQVNGAVSLNENIADSGGLMQSYRAYKSWLLQQNNCENSKLPGINITGPQLFFLSYAQSWCFSTTPQSLEISLTEDKHTPGNIRMIGAVRNIPDFAKVYNCPSDSFMNPSKRCKLW